MDKFIIKINKTPTTTTVTTSTATITTAAITTAAASTSSISSISRFENVENESFSDSETKSEWRPVNKRKKYRQKFCSSWTKQFEFLEEKDSETYCKVCHVKLKGGIFHIKRHSETISHMKTVAIAKSTPKINKIGFTQERRVPDPVKRAEIILTAFLAEHNLPFLLMDHLPMMCASAFPDSKIAEKVKMKRKKCTQLTLIIDETTDLSLKKSLAVVVRYFKKDKVLDSFLDLIEVDSADANSLYMAVKIILDENEIPYSNLVGLAADNANVMLGNIRSVQTLLKENINPNIVVVGCSCHSFNLCSSYACKSLPENVECFVHSVCNYFSNSSKRVEALKEFQTFCEESPSKILKLSKTRWLSLQMVITRILKHWNSLVLFFEGEFLHERIESAGVILNSFRDKIIKCYMLFLSYILEIINKLNVEFQSETPKICSLLEKVTNLYKLILASFIKKSVLTMYSDNISQLNPADPSNFLEIESMYFGANLEVFIEENKNIITKYDLQVFQRRALDFYVSLCQQIKLRFDFSSPVLKFASNFEPKNVITGNIRSKAKARVVFPDFVSIDLEQLNIEWALASEVGKKYELLEIDKFWGNVCETKNEMNELMFPNLKCLVRRVLALPHSSAAAERIFSSLNLIKVKTRNRLLITTVSAILHTKELIRNGFCYNFEPDEKIINYKHCSEVEVLEEDIFD